MDEQRWRGRGRGHGVAWLSVFYFYLFINLKKCQGHRGKDFKKLYKLFYNVYIYIECITFKNAHDHDHGHGHSHDHQHFGEEEKEGENGMTELLSMQVEAYMDTE